MRVLVVSVFAILLSAAASAQTFLCSAIEDPQQQALCYAGSSGLNYPIVAWPPDAGGGMPSFYSAIDFYIYVLDTYGSLPEYPLIADQNGWPESFADLFARGWLFGYVW